MKCPCCNGTGRTPTVTIVKTDSGLPCDFPCIECDGTGKVEMTNEYFLQTATTEQLAEWIKGHMNCNFCSMRLKCEDMRDCMEHIKAWLKQPCTPIS
jgi:hypothetical protein